MKHHHMHEGKHHKHGGHAKHHHKKGGRIDMKVSGNPDVFEEAAEKKHGGKAHHKKKHHRKTGGKVVGLMTGGAVRPRLDRPGRKAGGRVGANTSPLSTAHNTSAAPSTPKTQQGGLSD